MRLTLIKGVGVVGLGATTTPAQVQAMITTAAAGYSVPDLASVALGVAQHESQFTATAQNPSSSAAGVFQLVSSAQQYTGVTNPLDAQQNVNAGVSLLAQYYNTYGNWPQALQAFSDGPGTVQQGLPPSQQTLGLEAYVQANYGVDLSGGGTAVAATGTDTGDGTDSTDIGTGTGLDLSLTDASGDVNWTTVGLIAAAAALAVSLS
jgi:Transglycosylase SLT domain